MTRVAIARLRPFVFSAVALMVSAVPFVTAAEPPRTATLVQELLSQPEARASSYRAVRRLSAANERFHVSGWIEATTELDPERGFTYQVTAAGGSDYIRRKVLLPVLERERAAIDGGESPRAALTSDNYLFGDAADDEDGSIVIPIVPRRQEALLVAGRIVLTADGDLNRLEGRLVKRPSFWTRRVDVVRRYGRVNGVRVPLETTSAAQVVIAGASTFAMCYDYESVNGTPVSPRHGC